MLLGIKPTVDFAFKKIFGSPEGVHAAITVIETISQKTEDRTMYDQREKALRDHQWKPPALPWSYDTNNRPEGAATYQPRASAAAFRPQAPPWVENKPPTQP